MTSTPSRAYLLACLSYDPETGILTRKERPLHHFFDAATQRSWNTRWTGKTVAQPQRNGKSRIRINGQTFTAYGLIWAMQTDTWPTMIGHKNGDSSDNRWANLWQPRDHINPPAIPTTEFLLECFWYEPKTGWLIWKTRPAQHFKRPAAAHSWNARFAGNRVGVPNRDGHIRFPLSGSQFTAHRIIWFMQTGKWPKGIDHANGDPADNRWENLREATTQENAWNRRRSGELPKGVMKARSGPNFWARATFLKKDGTPSVKHLGTYDTPERAHEAWRIFVRRERGEFFRAD